MVMSLLSTQSAKGLFAKVGVQSGASLRPPTSLAEAEQRGVELATKVGLPGANATMDQLRAVPAEKLAGNRDMARLFASPIDGRFRTKATVDAFADGSATYVPLLIGSNNGEGGFDNARKVAALMSSKAPAFLYQFAYVDGPPPGAPRGSMASD